MNKIIVSIVLAIILVLGINKITDVIFYIEKPEKSAYQVASVVTEVSSESSETTSEGSGSEDFMTLLTSANAGDGKKIFSKCGACHTIDKGKPNKIGPNLWNVLGRKTGSIPDYKYSKALATYGKTWNLQEINGFLLNPKKWIPKNKMGFIGLKKPEDRAAIILYLNENTDNPLALQ